MKKITVHLKERSYPILVGRGFLSSVGWFLKPLKVGSKVLIVSNRRVAQYFLKPVCESLKKAGFQGFSHYLSHGDERDKSEKELLRLWSKMAQIPLDRTSTVIALGGGVVGDLTAFATSTYMRGVALVQIPTTLLAQVDSAIGGKTAIDLPAAKNMVGTFYQPRMVICDIMTLNRLGLKEFRNSFAEVIKYGIIQDPPLFELLERKADRFFSSLKRKVLGPSELTFLETIVWRSALVKSKVVERDERETKGKRMILNYGHTFAHALEGASGFKIPHGEAVAKGMILAGELAFRMGIFGKDAQARQERLIKQVGFSGNHHFSGAQLLSFMKRDKKVRDGKLRLVLPKKIGQVGIYQVSEKEVLHVLEHGRSIR